MKDASIKRRGDVRRIMLLLVDTGAVWVVIQFVYSILRLLAPPNFTPVDYAVAVIAKAALYLARILPTATLIIVRSKQSVEHTLNFASTDGFGPVVASQRSRPLPTIRFEVDLEGVESVPSLLDRERRHDGEGVQMAREPSKEKGPEEMV